MTGFPAAPGCSSATFPQSPGPSGTVLQPVGLGSNVSAREVNGESQKNLRRTRAEPTGPLPVSDYAKWQGAGFSLPEPEPPTFQVGTAWLAARAVPLPLNRRAR